MHGKRVRGREWAFALEFLRERVGKRDERRRFEKRRESPTRIHGPFAFDWAGRVWEVRLS